MRTIITILLLVLVAACIIGVHQYRSSNQASKAKAAPPAPAKGDVRSATAAPTLKKVKVRS